MWAEGVAPIGLEDDLGSLAGRVRMRLSKDAPHGLRFLVASDPPSALTFAGKTEFEIPAGRRTGGLNVHALEEGEATVVISLLDADGTTIGDPWLYRVTTIAAASIEKPRVWIQASGEPRSYSELLLRVRAGRPLGALRFGRTAFAAMHERDTVFTVEVDDPDGILPQLPESVSVPAGEDVVAREWRLNECVGRARIRFKADDTTIELVVESYDQTWSVPASVRVPLGAEVSTLVRLGQGAEQLRHATVAVAQATVASLVGEPPTWQPRDDMGFLMLRGVALGATVVNLESDGLPNLCMQVEVVPPTLTIVDGSLRIHALDPSTDGIVELWLPNGATFASLDVPAALAEHVVVTGMGSRHLRLTWTADPNLPAELTLPVQLAGASPDTLTVREERTGSTTLVYRLPLR